jgi:sec-independent protein translocase protein TatA
MEGIFAFSGSPFCAFSSSAPIDFPLRVSFFHQFYYFCRTFIYKTITIMRYLLFMPQGWEWIILLVVVLLLFGGRKIPELMKGIGKGIKGFKDGMKDLEDEIKSDK